MKQSSQTSYLSASLSIFFPWNTMQMQSLWSSSSSSSCLLCLVIVSLFVQNIQIQARFVLPKGVKIPALIAFGDSIVDPGNNNYISTIAKCDFPPYGKDFMGGKPTGRFCNGKIPTDLIADELGIKETVPAYLDPTLKPADLLTGVSFASGACGYVPLTSQIVSVISLPDQLTFFKEYIGKLKAYAGEAKTASIISDSVYFLVAGSDDIANTYFGIPGVQHTYDPDSYTDLMVQKASSFLQGLHDLGARKIGIVSVPPIGCVPAQRTLQGGIQRDCGTKENEVATIFNSKLSSALNQLNKVLNGRFVYIDIYNPLLDIIQNPHKYGFEVANKGCCGTGAVEASVFCNSLSSSTCADASKYVFWDSYHPTQRAYEEIADLLLQKYSNALL